MTLRLVSDNSDPSGPDFGDIPEMLRQYANEIEAAQYGEVLSAIIILERPEGVPLVIGCGEDPTPYEMMGLFEAAKLRIFADDVCGVSDD